MENLVKTKQNKAGLRVIFYPEWAMQCCGQEFMVGDSIQWTMNYPDEHSRHIGRFNFDYLEEHHHGYTHEIVGTIERICFVVYIKSEEIKEGNTIDIDAQNLFLVDTNSVTGWNLPSKNLSCAGYLVWLDHTEIKKLTEEKIENMEKSSE